MLPRPHVLQCIIFVVFCLECGMSCDVLVLQVRSPNRRLFQQKYGILAAMQDASAADLTGVLAWDLMHLNKNGFTFAPNAGGISGLVDETTFFNPVYEERGDEDMGLENILERVVASQYVEVIVVCSQAPRITGFFAVDRALYSVGRDIFYVLPPTRVL